MSGTLIVLPAVEVLEGPQGLDVDRARAEGRRGQRVTGRYEARAVTRLCVEVVEIVWIPEGGPPTPLFAVAADRVPLIAAALDAWLRRAEA